MGLMLSVLVFCVGVLEALSCIEHVRNSYLPFQLHKKRKRRLLVDINTGKARHCMVDAVWPGDVPRNQHVIRKRSGYSSLPNSVDTPDDEGDNAAALMLEKIMVGGSPAVHVVGLPAFTPEDLQHALSSALFERDEELIEEEDEEEVVAEEEEEEEEEKELVMDVDSVASVHSGVVIQQEPQIGLGETPSDETSTTSEELTEIFKPSSPVHSTAVLPIVNDNDQTDIDEDELEAIEYLNGSDKQLLIKDKQMGPLDLNDNDSINNSNNDNSNANILMKEAVMAIENNLIKSAEGGGILKTDVDSVIKVEKTKNETHQLVVKDDKTVKHLAEETVEKINDEITGESAETNIAAGVVFTSTAADTINNEKKTSKEIEHHSKKTVHIQLKDDNTEVHTTSKISSTDRPLSVETFTSEVAVEKTQNTDFNKEEEKEKVKKKLEVVKSGDGNKLFQNTVSLQDPDQDLEDTVGMEHNEFQQMVDNKQDIDSLKKIVKRKPKRKHHKINHGRMHSVEESDKETDGQQEEQPQRKVIDIELVECVGHSSSTTVEKIVDEKSTVNTAIKSDQETVQPPAVKHNLVKMKSSFDDDGDAEDVVIGKKQKSHTISVKPSEPMAKPQMEPMDDPTSPDKAFWLIFSGEYTKAMSKDWHSGHFCCWQCDESLTGQRYVLRDDHPYCIKCYESVFANTCDECNKTIGIDSKDLSYKDKHWHEACFFCNKCKVSLVDKQFGSKADKIYCGNCYDAQFASRCDGCGQIFRAGTKKMEYKTRQWHEQCFCCCVCKTPIGTKSFIPREQEIYCATCYEEKFATRCVKCNKIITSGGVTYKNEPWHRECFTCTNCNTSLAGQRFTSREEKPYCADCFGELFAKRCTACCKPITGIGGTRFISFEDRHWHNDCFICAACKSSLVGRGFITDAEDILCTECAKQKLM